jgi:hypothetical protein
LALSSLTSEVLVRIFIAPRYLCGNFLVSQVGIEANDTRACLNFFPAADSTVKRCTAITNRFTAAAILILVTFLTLFFIDKLPYFTTVPKSSYFDGAI